MSSLLIFCLVHCVHIVHSVHRRFKFCNRSASSNKQEGAQYMCFCSNFSNFQRLPKSISLLFLRVLRALRGSMFYQNKD